MNNTLPNKIDSNQIKKYLIIATIILVTVCAFLAIFAIFIGSNLTLLNTLSTLLIMYLVLIYSTNNIKRLSDNLAIVRILSYLALIANFFWSLLWILLVWNVFGGFSIHEREVIWKIVGSAAVISVFCTILAARIVYLINWPTVIVIYKSLPLVCVGFLGIDLLLMIWFPSLGGDIFIKLFLAECILLTLQFIVTKLLISNASRLGIGIAPTQPWQPNQPDQSNQSATSPTATTQSTTQTTADGKTPSTQPSSNSPEQFVTITDDAQNQTPVNPPSTPTTPAQGSSHSFLSIIGIVALAWIGLSIVIPIIGSIIIYLLDLAM